MDEIRQLAEPLVELLARPSEIALQSGNGLLDRAAFGDVGFSSFRLELLLAGALVFFPASVDLNNEEPE